MEAFVRRHQQNVIGVLSGFDRMRFRGTLRSISYAEGLDRFLGAAGVRYKDFGTYAQGLSEQLKDHARQVATRVGRPLEYLASSRQEKEAVAKADCRAGRHHGGAGVCPLVRGAVHELLHPS